MSDIADLAARYDYDSDDEALAAGKRILQGDYSRNNLKVIVRWKSARRLSLIDDNAEHDVTVALG